MSPWQRVKHLFEYDDGSLPDIFVKNLSAEDIVVVYEWVMSQCTIIGNPTLWSLEAKSNVAIRELPCPARSLVQGKVEGFHHSLEGLCIGEVELPALAIFVDICGITFDYRMGSEWGEREVLALFEFLRRLRKIVPHASIEQAYEGRDSHPNLEFSETLQTYLVNANG